MQKFVGVLQFSFELRMGWGTGFEWLLGYQA